MNAFAIADTPMATSRTPFLQQGLTLIELMVALVIGLVLVIAMSAAFVSSSTSRREVELSSDVIESGRYAVDVLSRELSQTGFYGVLGAPTGAGTNVGNLCSIDVAQWGTSLPFYVVGLGSAASANIDADPACLIRKPGTDAIFIQRAATCTSVECGPENAAFAYLQVSECGEEYNTAGKQFVVAKGLDPALSLKTKACAGVAAERRQLIRRIYYVSTADVLSYIEISPAGASAPVAIVENIEQMQISYGVDTDGDGTADSFSSSPADWTQVVGARMWLLARSSSLSRTTADAADFALGDDTTISVAAATRNLKRRVYSTYIPFVTPRSRRES